MTVQVKYTKVYIKITVQQKRDIHRKSLQITFLLEYYLSEILHFHRRAPVDSTFSG